MIMETPRGPISEARGPSLCLMAWRFSPGGRWEGGTDLWMNDGSYTTSMKSMAISGTDLLEVPTIYKAYVRAK